LLSLSKTPFSQIRFCLLSSLHTDLAIACSVRWYPSDRLVESFKTIRLILRSSTGHCLSSSRSRILLKVVLCARLLNFK
ncbi:hypothetical protein VIGAN_05071000, partial [Vigna angularis var. angularis]